MKCLTREDAVHRYGPIDFASRYWPNESQWLTTIQIAQVFPDWKVLDTDLPVRHIVCNSDMAGPLTYALHRVDDLGMGWILRTYDGCLNIRMVRGTNNLFSAHSYGLAIDLNAADNPLGATSGGFYDKPLFVKCFTDEGLDWGGSFTGRKDPMHFSYCWE